MIHYQKFTVETALCGFIDPEQTSSDWDKVTCPFCRELMKGHFELLAEYGEKEESESIFYPTHNEVETGGFLEDSPCGEGSFERELSSLINRHSKENRSNTPDFILAEYLSKCLENFNSATKAREEWSRR